MNKRKLKAKVRREKHNRKKQQRMQLAESIQATSTVPSENLIDFTPLAVSAGVMGSYYLWLVTMCVYLRALDDQLGRVGCNALADISFKPSLIVAGLGGVGTFFAQKIMNKCKGETHNSAAEYKRGPR